MYVVNKLRENEKKRLNSDYGSYVDSRPIKVQDSLPILTSLKSLNKNNLKKRPGSKEADNNEYYDKFFNDIQKENLRLKDNKLPPKPRRKKVETVDPRSKKLRLISVDPQINYNAKLMSSEKVPVVSNITPTYQKQLTNVEGEARDLPKLLDPQKSKRSVSELFQNKNTLRVSTIKPMREFMSQSVLETEREEKKNKGCFIFSCFG